MSNVNHQVLLASRPRGPASTDNFRLVEARLSPLREGEVRVRNHYLSLDPYMRGRMDEGTSYAASQPLGDVMVGGTAGRVVESRNPDWRPGDSVVGSFGWQEYGTSDGSGLRKVDDTHIPLSAFLGPVGMPGVTAWHGLNRVCQPKRGETVVVSAASGAVGTVAGQLTRKAGCRVVGVAGGPEKCGFVVGELGFDACVDYKAGDFGDALARATPGGIDAYFDNVGGAVLDAVMLRMNPMGRIAACGAVAGYDGAPAAMANPLLIVVSQLRIEGFIISSHPESWPVALAELEAMVAGKALQYRETVAEGLASAPEAFLGMLKGRNFGKQLVRLV